MNLSNKNILVTGASSGIGKRLVGLLDERGARVLAVSRSIDSCDLGPCKAKKLACDVSAPANLDSMLAAAQGILGPLDVLVCNAGFAYYEKLGRPDWEHIQEIFRTNVFACIYLAQKMREISGERPYTVAITASAMSFWSIPGYSLYASTKAALRGFAEAYRWELKSGQRLMMTFPIATRTNFFESAGDGTPVPWPSQTAEQVAESIVKGLEKNRNQVFPSPLFAGLMAADRVLPFIKPMVAAVEAKKFRDWAAGRQGRSAA